MQNNDEYIKYFQKLNKIFIQKYEQLDSMPTANVGHADIINQMNNIGQTLDYKLNSSSEVTHEKLDKIIEQTSSSTESIDAGDNDMQKNISVNEYVEIKSDIREIKTSLNWIKWIIPLFITIGIFITGIIVNSIKEDSSMKYQMLDKKLDKIQELNSMQIQRDVAIEVKNQKISK